MRQCSGLTAKSELRESLLAGVGEPYMVPGMEPQLAVPSQLDCFCRTLAHALKGTGEIHLVLSID